LLTCELRWAVLSFEYWPTLALHPTLLIWRHKPISYPLRQIKVFDRKLVNSDTQRVSASTILHCIQFSMCTYTTERSYTGN
jgi:hypothetical protein